MIIDLRHEPASFRAALRDWLHETVPADWAQRAARWSEQEYLQFQRRWMAERAKQGLVIPHWPSAYGGADLDLSGQIMLADELARARAPGLELFTVSLNHLPGTLLPFGTEAQKRAYLPAVIKGTIWCQGFSEPGAGSDLASLRCNAERQGDHYVVNGQKTWSSFSRFADHCILLVRTSTEGAKQAGITFLIMDMDTPGLEVRAIRQIDGQAEFSELFLTDVRIPVANRVGEENRGWAVANATLASERGVLWFDWAERRAFAIEAYFKDALAKRAWWLKDDGLRREFMALFAEIQAGRRLIRHLLRENDAHQPSAAITAAFVKLHDTTLHQRLSDLRTRIEGLAGQRYRRGEDQGANGMFDFISAFGATISGGTNEVMRNIIAERGLGLPRG